MARYAGKTTVTRDQVSEFADSLRRIAAMLDNNAASMQEFGVNEIEATHGKTREDVVDGLFRVCGAIQQGLAEAVLAAAKKTPAQVKPAAVKSQKKP